MSVLLGTASPLFSFSKDRLSRNEFFRLCLVGNSTCPSMPDVWIYNHNEVQTFYLLPNYFTWALRHALERERFKSHG